VNENRSVTLQADTVSSVAAWLVESNAIGSGSVKQSGADDPDVGWHSSIYERRDWGEK